MSLGFVSRHSIQYVCGYVVKKFNKNHPALGGLHPEFVRMSNRPGIGRGAVKQIAAVVTRYKLDQVGGRYWDVPNQLRHGKVVLPLGRYIVEKLREECGHDAKTGFRKAVSWSDDMSAMFAVARKNKVPLTRAHEKEVGNLGKNLAGREKSQKRKVL